MSDGAGWTSQLDSVWTSGMAAGDSGPQSAVYSNMFTLQTIRRLNYCRKLYELFFVYFVLFLKGNDVAVSPVVSV